MLAQIVEKCHTETAKQAMLKCCQICEVKNTGQSTTKIYEEIIQLMEKTAGYCKLVGCMAINKTYFK